MDGLIKNIDKLRTTDMGAERIKRNIGLAVAADAVEFCKRHIEQADETILKGKNWYVYKGGIVITVNAHSCTVITAHKIKTKQNDHSSIKA